MLQALLFQLLVILNHIVLDSYEIFNAQLSDVLFHFPDLKVIEKDNKKFLKGVLDIPNSEGEIVYSFLIEIHCTKSFPYRFPKLYEIGGYIPCEADWHKYNDNSCCITVEPEEILICKNGITVLSFIRNQVIPYLANQSYRMLEGEYKDEYPHGTEGYAMFYSNLMKTSDVKLWLQYVNYAFVEMAGKAERNKLCFCGSGIKYKNCHDKVFDQIRCIGKENILKDFYLFTK